MKPKPGRRCRAQAATPVGEAFLSCEAQRWMLSLGTGDAQGLAGSASTLRIDGRAFETRLALHPAALAIRVPRDVLDPLKRGLRLEIAFDGPLAERIGAIAYPLRGSGVAIAAVEERCSQRDMSRFRPVTFTPYSSYANLARGLRAADMEAFTAATTAQPALDVAMAEFGEGRRVLFTRLCGSSWYYGRSGCNITGFAPGPAVAGETEAETPEWRPVYDAENAQLYTDPASVHGGWPDIIALPAHAPGEGRVWRWDGDGYALHGDLPEEDEEEVLPLRPGAD